MATYEQWRNGKHGKRVLWLCGPEQVLVQEIEAAFIQESRGPAPAFRFTARFTAGEHGEDRIWEECHSIPPAGERRLFIVRQAQRMEHMTNVSLLADRLLRDVWVLFVSAEDGYDRKAPDSAKREMFPGPAAVQALSCGQVVKCTLAEAGKLAWVQRAIPGIHEQTAWALLEKCGQDLTVLKDVADKVAAAGWPVVREALLPLVQAASLAGFEDDLIYGRRALALESLPAPGQCGRVLALLNSRLDVLSQLWSYRDATPAELEMKAHIPRMFVAAYRKVAVEYPPRRIQECRRLLAVLDTAWHHGAREGLMEALVALW